jgi:mono/diheme cytochrome c family protein
MLAAILALPFAGALLASDASGADYLVDIKPILERRCWRCHGPERQRSGLRLDSAAAILEGGNSGPAVVPGKSAESLLIEAVTGGGEAAVMPPAGERLSAGEIALLRAWIDRGAPAPAAEEVTEAAGPRSDHWAFQPLVRPPLPPVAASDWVRNPIDLFILSRLEREGLAPSPEAERTTLIRRLSLDLLGLPPSAEEVDAFLADRGADAYERLVDRLLDSPHYGERWGRHWLDLARYADSNGYTIDGSRSIWKYREWVIEALNRDLPFDRFTVEQLAGDMLPEATSAQLIATGFHRNTLVNEEGGTDPEEFRVEAVVDRVSTTGSVFLGLTLGCARCHDHKYDPVSQREFYQLFALFNNADEPTLTVPADEQVKKEEPALLVELEQEEKRLAETDAGAGARQLEWEQSLAGRLEISWSPLEPLAARAESGVAMRRLEDGSLLVEAGAERDSYSVSALPPLRSITAVRLEALTHDALPRRGPGLAPNGNFVLSELSLAVMAEPGKEPGTALPVALAAAFASHSQEKYPVEHAIDGRLDSGWAINVPRGSLNTDREAVFITAEELLLPPGARLVVTLEQRHSVVRYTLGRFRLSATSAAREALALPEAARLALAKPAEARAAAERQLLTEEFRKVDKERLPIAAKIAELKERRKKLEESTTTTLVMRERKEPRPTHVHIRGEFLRRGARVEPGVPAVLPPLAAARGGVPDRLDFARWLVDLRNPLTPRVTMNRIWQRYFGQGIVATENDFGTQGERPSHPELLDWLAAELIERGWSLKAMHRLIVTSATYRQSSRLRPELAEVDPYNRLLGRQARLRLEAEAVRDAALAVSGLLSREIGGPGVYPPQPQGIYRFTQNVKFWKESEGADRYRRGMYTFFWRSSPHPALSAFDAPDATVACTRRVRSNTPLQALMLANDRAFFEAAQALAARVLGERPCFAAPQAGAACACDAERLRHAFRLCLSREPDERESRRLREFLESQRRRYRARPEEAETAAPALPAAADLAEAAAWTATARVLINLDEFITRE